ncbi:hypothetical protein P152DRAFT_457674 [Eremomyces bilateralis CBS 781.70]|uniref:Uncharacterized protein n=1 Tax=Eremomyces bilateralis CBS 781.70 TaxID=1392243 RepID=A0A6G1G5H7_9PEZI|nr:uncharacterized protein P152DRAFT_457674 [Eremomyces bilateralis CBS 781.70]KAF1813313.1 hypothetical protein P152DRAFT_457674 [Eremomyces bilateralis CBS 781.70]
MPEHEHIPVPKDNPSSTNPQDPSSDQQPYRASIHHLADPAGAALSTTLQPLGSAVSTLTTPLTKAVGGITRPVLGPLTGEKEEKMEVLGGENRDSYKHGKESVAGRERTGKNPLGLEEGWGFREEEGKKGGK